MGLSWPPRRWPGQGWLFWVLVAHDHDWDRELVRLTNRPIETAAAAQTVDPGWRSRPQIEPTYRCDQEDGLDVEDMRSRFRTRMCRLFLLAAMVVCHLGRTWPEPAVRWLRCLGGKRGFQIDCDGPSLLAGSRAVFAYAAHHPFPRGGTSMWAITSRVKRSRYSM